MQWALALLVFLVFSEPWEYKPYLSRLDIDDTGGVWQAALPTDTHGR